MQGGVLMQVEEGKLRQPSFFASLPAQDCVRSQMEQDRFGCIDKTLGPEAGGNRNGLARPLPK